MSHARKLIALSCSPSRGRNSDTMLDHFLIGASKIEDLDIEKIYLEDIKFDHYNYENGKHPLPHESEFEKLATKLQKIDALVIATPTYNFSVPAHLKNFIDRIRFVALDRSKKNKLGQPVGLLGNLRLYYLVSGGTPRWAQKLLFFAYPPFWLRAVFLYYGGNCMGAFYSGDIKTFENKKVLAKCEKKGEGFAKMVKKSSGNRILEKIFWRPPQH